MYTLNNNLKKKKNFLPCHRESDKLRDVFKAGLKNPDALLHKLPRLALEFL